MAFRIFIGIIGLLCAFMIYDSARVMFVKRALASVDDSYALSSENADLTVVEFFDYGCPRCHAMHPELMDAIERDGRIKLIIRPVRSLSSASGTQMARLVYAAGAQGQFVAAHKYVTENSATGSNATFSQDYIRDFAQALKLDEKRLVADMGSAGVQKHMDDNYDGIAALNVQRLPALLIDGKVLLQVGGDAPSSNELLYIFKRVRG